MDNNITNQETKPEELSGNQNKKQQIQNTILGILIVAVFVTEFIVVLYAIDVPKLTIDEDMLGTDVYEGKVLYLYAGEDPTPPTTVDYTVKSYFGKPIGNVKYLVTTSNIAWINFGTAPKNYIPYEVLQFQSTPEFQPNEIHGQLYIHANNMLKKGETSFVTLKIYADWLDYRPKGLEEATDYWTSEPIETVTVKLYG